ncbi:MAG: DNA primase [Oscillospiraceae bacterium]|nr:DNA primase [Oscillospiraceae bacterium]
MRISDEFLFELRQRCNIEDIVSGYVQLKRRGKNLVGLCPFHNEKTPSFTVYPESGSFYCFGCGAGGEVVSFIRRAENLDFTEAVRFLCDRVGMTVPADGFDDSLAQKRKRIYEMNREAAKFFHECLLGEKGRAALQYYLNRGYTKKTITRFGLGYAPNEWRALLTHLREKGYSYEDAYEANLAQKSEKNGKVSFYDNFRNRVIVPIIDARGNVVAFGGRVLDDSKPKYINTSDTPVYKKSLGVFGLNFAKNSKERSLILVEGYMDAIALHQAGFTNSIACLGTALTGEMAHLLSRYADEILLAYDNDEAGRKATERAIGVFSSIGMKIRVIRLSGGKDPDEILKKFGAEKMRSLIEGAENEIEFALLKARDGLDLESSDGKVKYLTLAAEVLSSVKNSIAVDVYSSRLAEELGVEKAAIDAKINQLKRQKAYGSQKKKYDEIQRDSLSKMSKLRLSTNTSLRSVRAQERIIILLFENPDFYPAVKEKLGPGFFSVPVLERIYTVISQRIKEHASLELTSLSSELSNEEISEFVRLTKQSERFSGTKKELLDCIEVVESEKERTQTQSLDVSGLSDEDFLKAMDKLKNKK